MRRSIALFLLLVAFGVQARDVTFAWQTSEYLTPEKVPRFFTWSPSTVKMTLNAQNTAYNQSENTFEVRNQIRNYH